MFMDWVWFWFARELSPDRQLVLRGGVRKRVARASSAALLRMSYSGYLYQPKICKPGLII